MRLRLVMAAATAAALAGPASAVATPPADCVTSGPAGTAYQAGVNCRQVEVDGAQRRYVVYVPARRPPRRGAPVVMMFHGSSGSGVQFLRISGWREQADRHRLIAVFPTGLRYRVLDSGRRVTKWNDYTLASEVDLSERPPGYPANAPMPADDVGFADAILADLRDTLSIDRRRVFASGFSNGAGFTARLAIERSDVLAAAGIAAGGLPGSGSGVPVPVPARQIPLFALVGTLDDRILAKTGPPPLSELPLDPLALLSLPSIDGFLDAQLAALGVDQRFFGLIARQRSTSLRWPATGLARYRFAVLAGLEHKYPNARNNPFGFEAAPRFWRFFRSHPLR